MDSYLLCHSIVIGPAPLRSGNTREHCSIVFVICSGGQQCNMQLNSVEAWHHPDCYATFITPNVYSDGLGCMFCHRQLTANFSRKLQQQGEEAEAAVVLLVFTSTHGRPHLSCGQCQVS